VISWLHRRTRTWMRALPAGPAGPDTSGAPGRDPGVMLVHGAYADASSWSEVIERLQRAGLTATAVQNPLISLADDVAHTRRILALRDGPVILAGHSFAGTVITEAGTHPNVVGLVYIAAGAPTRARTVPRSPRGSRQHLPTRALSTPAGSGRSPRRRSSTTSPTASTRSGARALRGARTRLGVTFHEKTTVAAWRSKPSWYAISRQDRTISPELQRFLANRMNGTTFEIDSGHLSPITHPDEVTELILDAVQAAHR
jgi:pimeloyl-ACP methyl ester carboxylesterase